MSEKAHEDKKIYTAAVIGCGRIGLLSEKDVRRAKPATHCGGFTMHPRIRLAAVADTDPAKQEEARQMLPGVEVFSSAEEMLENVHPDIVSIATPHAKHYDGVLLAAERGVPLIMCEKPIAETTEEAERMINAARNAGSILLVNHMRRFDPVLQDVARMIKDKEIGEMQVARCVYVNGLFNTGSHLIDFLRLCLGEVIWVSAYPSPKIHSDTDMLVDAIINFENDVMVSMQALDSKHYAVFEIDFFGTKNVLSVKGLGQTVEMKNLRDSNQYVSYKEPDENHPVKIAGEGRSFFSGMTDHIVSCLDGDAKPLSTGEDALAALRVLLAIKESAQSDGKKIFLT